MTHLSTSRRPAVGGWTLETILSLYLPVLLLLTLRLASPSTTLLAYISLAAFALLGRPQAIVALALSWLFTMINPELAPEGGGGAGRYVVILAAAVSAMLQGGFMTVNLRVRPFTLATILLTAFLVGHSLLISPMPDVSILKAASWGLSMTASISLWAGLKPNEFKATSGYLFWGLALVLVLSLPFLGLPPGYARNGTGFQGILNHPQAFGMTMALLGAWAAARMLGERRPAFVLIALTGAALVMVILTQARTAGIALVLGLALSVVLSPMFAGRGLLQMSPGLMSSRVWLVIGGCLVAGLAMATAFSDLILRFLFKSNRASSGTLLQAYDASRGFLIDAMLANIAESPVSGIGFGIASHPGLMLVERDSVFGLPLSAAIEKGVAPLAILEEVGVLGAILVAGWLFWLLRRGAVGGLVPFAVCLTALLLNMGENTLFSPGGQGLLVLVLFGWAYASGIQRKRHD